MRRLVLLPALIGLALPAAAGPSLAAGKADLGALYDRLAKAGSDEEATGIAGAIARAQLQSGSDTADLLMGRAIAAGAAGDVDTAIRLLSATLSLDPDFTEAWNRRATLYYGKNDYQRAMADIAQTLKRDPRHFGAWSGLGMILKETGDDKRAYAAFQRALAINPHLDAIRKLVDEMKPQVEGRDI